MDGEALISSQDLKGMTEVEMLAELKHLEDWGPWQTKENYSMFRFLLDIQDMVYEGNVSK